jgi:hypothetical protein
MERLKLTDGMRESELSETGHAPLPEGARTWAQLAAPRSRDCRAELALVQLLSPTIGLVFLDECYNFNGRRLRKRGLSAVATFTIRSAIGCGASW